MNLDAYLRRLEFASAPAVDLDGLERLQDRHLLGVPVHNFALIAGERPDFEIATALRMIVDDEGGGPGLLLNLAFAALLREIGFRVDLLAAFTYDPATKAFGGPEGRADHVALRVDLDQPYLVDVGFGAWPRQPFPFAERDDLKSYGERLRLVEADGGDALVLEMHRREALGFLPAYRFRPVACSDDEATAIWQSLCDEPASRLLGREEGSLAIPDGGMTIDAEGLHFRRGGRTQTEPFTNEAASVAARRRHFRA